MSKELAAARIEAIEGSAVFRLRQPVFERRGGRRNGWWSNPFNGIPFSWLSLGFTFLTILADGG